MTTKREELYRELEFLGVIGDESLRATVERVWLKIWQESGFEHLADARWWSVARSDNPISLPLLDHIRMVAKTALRLADTAADLGANIDRDLLTAGALLLDVDKYVLMTPTTREPTVLSDYTQHTFYGAHVALNEGAPLKLVKMILSHSKNTAVRPKTPEAVILHYADYAVVDIRGTWMGNTELFAEDKPKWSRK